MEDLFSLTPTASGRKNNAGAVSEMSSPAGNNNSSSPNIFGQSQNAGAVSEEKDNGKPMRKKCRKKNEPISLETLQELFNLTRAQAARFLDGSKGSWSGHVARETRQRRLVINLSKLQDHTILLLQVLMFLINNKTLQALKHLKYFKEKRTSKM